MPFAVRAPVRHGVGLCPRHDAITKGVWSYHLMDTLRGSRTLTRPAYIQKLTPTENESLQADYRARNQELKTWELSRVHKLLFFII